MVAPHSEQTLAVLRILSHPGVPYAGLALLALSLRLYGLDWGAFHPDEWAISGVVQGLSWPDSPGQFFSVQSPLNPQWFNYGSLPLYAFGLISSLADNLRGIVSALPDDIIIWRGTSGLADAVTVILVARIGQALSGPRVALLAGFLYAVAVLPIQLSHFYTVDPLLTTLLTAALLASIHFARSGALRWGILGSVLFGLALATKASGVLFLWPVALAWLLWAVRRGESPVERARWMLAAVVLGGGVTFAVFALGQPYALLDWRTFLEDVQLQARLVRGAVEFPYTVQYDQTTPFLYQLRNLVVWGLGPPLGLAALAGVVLLAIRAVRRRHSADVILIIALLIPFLLIGVQQVKFMRYLLPLYPLLAVAASLFVVEASRALRRGPMRLRWTSAALVMAVVVPSVFYAFAFVSIYAGPHPVQRMSEWIQSNVPRDAVIATEAWDQAFPGAERFSVVQVSPYDPDSEPKAQRLAQTLAGSDYAFLFSNRAYGALSRLPERFPLMRSYYQQLLGGDLGYQVVHVETAYPNALGVSLVDETFSPVGLDPPVLLASPSDTPISLILGSADESFTVYDHPKVILLQNTEKLSEAELSARLRPALPSPSLQSAALPPQLMMEPDLARAQREGGAWDDIFAQSGPAVRYPLAVWFLAFQVIAFAGMPLMVRVFRPLPDRGYLIGKVFSLLIVAYVAWLLASLQWMAFSRESVLLGVLGLATVSALVGYRTRRELVHLIRSKWRVFLTAEVLFTTAFLLFALIRAANPDLWHPFRGGEKPMDLAYLTAVTRSTFMPPYDPWFAGGYLNYYYFGQFIIATMIRLTGIVPAVAFNLAIPLLWALTVGGAYSIVYNLAEMMKGRQRPSIPGVRTGPILAGLAAAFFVALAGNLDGILQVGRRIQDGVGSAGSGMLGVVTATFSGQGFDYWRSSRMIDVPGSISITEFPFFTFLFGDLHAHLIAMPLTLLVIGLAITAAFAVASRRGLLSRLLPLVALALPLGALFATNAWDYPTYLVVAPVAIVLAYLSQGQTPARAIIWGVVVLAGTLALSYGAFAPYHRDNIAFYTEIVTSPEQTPVRSYLAIFGLPLFVIVAALGLSLWRTLGMRARALGGLAGTTGAVAAMRSSEGRWVWAALAIVAGVAAIVFPFAVRGYEVVAINVVLVIGLSIVMLASETRLPQRLSFAAATLALILIAGVDLFAIQDHLVRMNTIFRVYLQAWVLLGLSAGFLLWWLVQKGVFRSFARSAVKLAFVVGLMVLVISASIYPVLGARARLADRIEPRAPLTLDGMAFMDAGFYRDVGDVEIELRWEREALEWLRAETDGTPVIAEAVLPPPPDDITYYRLLSRVAVYTGLPVIIGWPWHQTQQRGIGVVESTIKARLDDVRVLFDSGDPERVRAVLRTYDVEYVFIGQLERAYYSPNGLGVLSTMPEMDVVYENPGTTIYRVIWNDAVSAGYPLDTVGGLSRLPAMMISR